MSPPTPSRITVHLGGGTLISFGGLLVFPWILLPGLRETDMSAYARFLTVYTALGSLALYHYMTYARITLGGTMLHLPKTSDRGVPLFPRFRRHAVDVGQLSRIINYRETPRYFGGSLTLKTSAWPNAVMSIVARGIGPIHISPHVYDRSQLETLIDALLDQREDLQIQPFGGSS